MKVGAQGPVRLPLRGQRWLASHALVAAGSQLPVELRRVNHTASTNKTHCSARCHRAALQWSQMAAKTYIEQISDRVDRLLLRHEELQRTNTLLLQQVRALSTERDGLKSQLHAARTRLDALMQKLPADNEGVTR